MTPVCSKILADMFIGVEAGYQGDKARIVDPQEAAQRVAYYAKGSLNNSAIVQICPAVAVYGTARGCPVGGEAVAFVRLTGSKNDILDMAVSVYERFKQTTLSICTHDKLFGLDSRGFVFSLEGDPQQIGCMWQELSNDRIHKTGQEISCGIFESKKNQVMVQADANPHKIANIPDWEQASVEMIATLARRLGRPIHPTFRDTGFTYLKKGM